MDNKEAIAVLDDMKVKIAVPKSAVTQNKRNEALDLAINSLEEDRWIPVSEGLPKEGNKSYLVTVDYGDGVIASCQRFFYNGEIGWNDDCVIAWKPLPKPYESEEENES